MTRRRRALRPPLLPGAALLLSAVAASGCSVEVTRTAMKHTSVASYSIATPIHSIVVMNVSGDIDLVPGGTKVAVRRRATTTAASPGCGEASATAC